MKLTKQMRRIVVKKAIEFLYPEEEWNRLMKDLSKIVSPFIQKGIIEGWEKYKEYIRCSKKAEINTGSFGRITIDVEPYPMKLNTYYSTKSIPENELPKEGKEALLKVKKFLGDREDTRSQISDVLFSVTTSGKAMELLPEIKMFFPENIVKETSLVPMETIQALGRKILEKTKPQTTM